MQPNDHISMAAVYLSLVKCTSQLVKIHKSCIVKDVSLAIIKFADRDISIGYG